MNDAFEQEITDLLIKYRGIQSSIAQTNNSIQEIESQLSILESEQDTLKLCKPIIDDIINKFSDSLLKKLEELLTVGLQQIFYDRIYSVVIRVVDKRNSKCVELLLDDNGNLIPVRDSSVAGGILVVIASIIQIFFLINLNVDKILLLDEQFSQISNKYVEPFISFIKELCADTGLKIILITHDQKFMQYGDRTYLADKGRFTLQDTKATLTA